MSDNISGEAMTLSELYSQYVNFVDGCNLNAFEAFNILYADGKKLDVPTICYILGKLYNDGIIDR